MRKRPPSKFGVALVQEYRKRGLTQYSLAQKLGRSTRYLNNLEHDRNEPRWGKWRKGNAEQIDVKVKNVFLFFVESGSDKHCYAKQAPPMPSGEPVLFDAFKCGESSLLTLQLVSGTASEG